MRSKVVVLAAFASLLVSVPAMAADQGPIQYADAVAVFFEMDAGAPEVRQNAVVRFFKPVRVADKILMGKYIIEHDNDRMARGEPCTHIYDFYSRKLVAAFHCTHLDRPRSGNATVTLKPSPELPAVLTEFQYAGEDGAHGVPGR